MIIGVTGATKVGKSTFITDFKNKFGKYISPKGSYRDIPDLDLYENGTEESQRLIRDFMFRQIKQIWSKRDTVKHVIMDRTLLDNLAYTLVLYAKGVISDEFLVESFGITKKSMAMMHLVDFIPVTELDEIPVPEDIDEDFRMSVDTILKTFFNAYENRDDLAADLLPETKCAAIDKIFGTREERVAIASEILDEDGNVQGGFDTDTTPELYDQDGLGVSTERIASELSLENFGFTEEEIQIERSK
jgi:hypothetical protein